MDMEDNEPDNPRYVIPSATDQLFTRARIQYDRGQRIIAACLILDGADAQEEPPLDDLPEQEPEADRASRRIDQMLAVDQRALIRDAVRRDRFAKNKEIAEAVGCEIKLVISEKRLMQKNARRRKPVPRSAR